MTADQTGFTAAMQGLFAFYLGWASTPPHTPDATTSRANASLSSTPPRLNPPPVRATGSAVFTGLRGGLFWLAGARVVARLRLRLFSSLLKCNYLGHSFSSSLLSV